MCGESVDPNYFVELYRRETDPWNFEKSPYERKKYGHSLSVLRDFYESALEIACSIGVFTERLAPRCGRLLAMDVSPEAVETAKRRCSALSNVEFCVGAVPSDFPMSSKFDLVTFCEVGFYLDKADLFATRDAIVRSLSPDAHVLLVHWTPRVRGHATTTEEVHEAFAAVPNLRLTAHHDAETYRLDLFANEQSGYQLQ